MPIEPRLGVAPHQPDRTVIELVRELLKRELIDRRGAKGALTLVGAELDVDTSNVASELVRDPQSPWRNSLGAALRSLYGYSSQEPGARHTQYVDAEVAPAEAALVVRMCGAATVYFVDQHGK